MENVISFASTGFGVNSNHSQIVTSVGYYSGLLLTNLNESLISYPYLISYASNMQYLNRVHTFRTDHAKISAYSGDAV